MPRRGRTCPFVTYINMRSHSGSNDEKVIALFSYSATGHPLLAYCEPSCPISRSSNIAVSKIEGSGKRITKPKSPPVFPKGFLLWCIHVIRIDLLLHFHQGHESIIKLILFIRFILFHLYSPPIERF